MTARFVGKIAILIASICLAAQQGGGAIDVPASARQILRVKGDGFQVYTCNDTGQGRRWVLKAPDAKLIDETGKVIGTHFAGPTWKLEDGGAVQGELIASQPSTDAGAVAWLLLRAKAGTAIGSLGSVAFIRRTDTHGGTAGTAGCETEADVGKSERKAYTAAYTFYAAQ